MNRPVPKDVSRGYIRAGAEPRVEVHLDDNNEVVPKSKATHTVWVSEDEEKALRR